MQKFINIELVKEFGLRVSSCGVGVKEVKSKAKETTCVSSSIHIQIDKWEGWGNSMMMSVDEFEVNLGKDFLRRTHSMLIPWMDNMVIPGEQKAWVVCKTVRNSNGKVQLVSTLSMKIVVSWNALQFYAAFFGEVQEDGVGIHVQPKLTELVGSFCNFI
jgi:hypothetical protein